MTFSFYRIHSLSLFWIILLHDINQCSTHHDEIAFVMQKIIDCECDCHGTVINENITTSDGFDFEWTIQTVMVSARSTFRRRNAESGMSICTIESAHGQCISDTKSSKGDGCLIATATYGSERASEVQQLRELWDNVLLQTDSGTSFMNNFNQIYYSFSPIIADYERENPAFWKRVKVAITPMISSLSIPNHVKMSSDQEVLGYGISLILLNVRMYAGVPDVVVIGIRKKF